MRIPPAATTATQTPQSSVQHEPAGDSFAVVLTAASREPVPALIQLAPMGKEQTGQSSTSGEENKQEEVQSSPVHSNPVQGNPIQSNPVQNNPDSQASSDPSPDDRTESVMNETSGAQESISLPICQPSSIDTVRNSPSKLIDSRPQQPVPAGSIIGSGTKTKSEKHGLNRNTSDQAALQPTALLENENTINAAAIPQPIQIDASVADNSPAKQNDHLSNDGSSAASEDVANLPASTSGHNVPQPQVPNLSSNVAGPKLNTASDLPAVTTPLDATLNTDLDALNTPIEPPDLAAGTIESAFGPTLQQSIAPSIPSTVSNGTSDIQLAMNPAQRTDSNAARPLNTNLVSTVNSGAIKTKDEAAGSSNTPTQTAQNAQANPSQNVAPTPGVLNLAGSHPPAQIAGNPVVSHEAAIAPRLANTPVEASHVGARHQVSPSIDSESGEVMTASGISAAKLMQTMSESEMRIGLSSSGFGDISIRTSVSNHQLLAQISLDHAELSQAISAHVSSLQAKLGDEYGLRTSIEINNLASPTSGEPGHSSQREKRAAAGTSSAAQAVVPGEEVSGVSPEVFANAANGNRLDIRA